MRVIAPALKKTNSFDMNDMLFGMDRLEKLFFLHLRRATWNEPSGNKYAIPNTDHGWKPSIRKANNKLSSAIIYKISRRFDAEGLLI